MAPETQGSEEPVELKVEYSRLNSFFADYAKDLSQGETFVPTSNPLPIGTKCHFLLQIPTVDLPLHLNGKVMWVIREDLACKASPAGMGIELVADDAERQAVRETVEGLMQREFGSTLTMRLLQNVR